MGNFSVWLEARSPKVMYHAAPSKSRKSIEENGINFRIHFGNTPRPPKFSGVSYAPRGNYLDESKTSAIFYASGFGEPYDVWEVNVEGLKLFKDQAWSKGWRCGKVISPDKIKLIYTTTS